ncbi:MAG: YerC/YecD family TrpR-related protein [Candidatus Izemoplasmatales bacterium]|jgi:TrpR-related protein YerC/YecD
MAYEPKSKSNNMDLLCEALLQLETMEEAYRFLEDLCTMSELEKMSQRMEVAVMLFHKASYQKVKIKTKASTTTIGRINKSLKYGNNGYKTVFFRLKDPSRFKP